MQLSDHLRVLLDAAQRQQSRKPKSDEEWVALNNAIHAVSKLFGLLEGSL